MRATCWSLKPSMEDSRPVAAMMAPPGTPGAATIVMPSMKMNPGPLGGAHVQVLGEDDREGEGEDLRGRPRQVDRGAQGDGEGGHRVGDAVLLRLTQGHRDRGRRGGGAQGGEVGRDHGEQGLERVLAADDPGDDELDRQDDGLEDEDHDDDPQEGLHDRAGGAV